GGGRLAVEVIGADTREFGEDFRCSGCGAALERPQPLLFSFNHPLGACPECKGFGNVLKYDEALVVPDRTLSLAGGAVEPWTHPSGRWYQREMMKAARRRRVDTETPWDKLPPETREFVYGGDGNFPGIQGFFEEVESYRYKLHVRVFLSRYRSQSICRVCLGARLKPAGLAAGRYPLRAGRAVHRPARAGYGTADRPVPGARPGRQHRGGRRARSRVHRRGRSHRRAGAGLRRARRRDRLQRLAGRVPEGDALAHRALRLRARVDPGAAVPAKRSPPADARRRASD